jgi:hypothetical protein
MDKVACHRAIGTIGDAFKQTLADSITPLCELDFDEVRARLTVLLADLRRQFRGSFGQGSSGGKSHEDKSLVRSIQSPLSDEPGKAM